jgi:hypothetical protein
MDILYGWDGRGFREHRDAVPGGVEPAIRLRRLATGITRHTPLFRGHPDA